LTRKIMLSATRRKDIEEVARAGIERGSFSVSQSNSDYAARGERGDPTPIHVSEVSSK
jgi:hypothetical protein